MALDRPQVEGLFRKYGPLVRRRARSILGDDAQAEDATQDVFLKVLGSLNAFRGESLPSTWLYRITTNLCLNRLRDGKRHKVRLEELGADRTNRPPGHLGPDVEGRLTMDFLLTRVRPDLAEVAVYYHIDEMDQEEIAGVLGVARRTVGYRLERFRLEAQSLLGDQPPDQDKELATPKVAGNTAARGQKA